MPHQERGVVFIVSLLVITSLMALTAVGLTRSMTELAVSNRSVAAQQAFYLAEAGLDAGMQWLNAQSSPPGCPIVDGLCDPSYTIPTPLSVPQSLGNVGSYVVTIDPADTNPTTHIDDYTVRATATTTGVPLTRTLASLIRTESFARFAWFENNDRTRVGNLRNWFITGSVVRGPFHSNGQLNVFENPIFQGPVSTVAGTVNCWRGCPPYDPHSPSPPNDNPDFQQGIGLGAAAIQMPNPSLNELEGYASLVVNGNTTIELAGNTMLVTNSALGWSNNPVNVTSNPVVFVKSGDLTLIGGTLDGQLTLGSQQNILIANHVRYTCNPEDPATDSDCINGATGKVEYNDDLLGLVAKKSVVVSQNAPANLTIQATVMAVQESFELENNLNVPPKGNLHVFGGIIQNWIGITGWFNPSTGQVIKGYYEDYWYDERLLNTSPPYYPTTGQYQGVIWLDQ